MKVYRLVDEQYDPTALGECLSRISDNSNQKFGEGMYFATSKESARQFAATRKYKYTHLLECDINNVSENEFADLVDNESLVAKWNKGRYSKYSEACVCYCQEHSLKGLIWKSKIGWIELVLHSQHVLSNVVITDAEKLED